MDRLIQILKDEYHHVVRQPVVLRQVSAHEVNSRNFYVCCGGMPETRFVLKQERLEAGRTLDSRHQRLALHSHLWRQGSLVPSLVSTARGEHAALRDGSVISLTEFCSGGAFPGTPAATVAAARALAKLHVELANQSLPGRRESYDNLNDDEIRAAMVVLQRDRHQSRFAADLYAFVTCQMAECYEEIAAVEADQRLPRRVVHFDFHPANAIFNSNDLVAIVDLDSLATDFRMQAVAFAASRFGNLADPWMFLAAYDQVDPLTPHEISHYAHFVRKEAVRRINWLTRANILERKNLWQSELTRHLHCVRETARGSQYSQQAISAGNRLAG